VSATTRSLRTVTVLALIAMLSGCVTEPGSTAGTDIPVGDRKRVFHYRNGTLGKIRDSTDTRPAVEVADEDCEVAPLWWRG